MVPQNAILNRECQGGIIKGINSGVYADWAQHPERISEPVIEVIDRSWLARKARGCNSPVIVKF